MLNCCEKGAIMSPLSDDMDKAQEQQRHREWVAAQRRKIVERILLAILFVVLAAVGIGIVLAVNPDLLGQLLKLF